MKKHLLSSFLIMSAITGVAWNNNISEEICTIAPETITYDWGVAVLSDGTVTTGWNGPGTDGSGISTYFNRHDKDGNCMFAEGAMLVDELETKTYTVAGQMFFVDKDENCILSYQTFENAFNAGLNTDVNENYRLYKISPEGEMLWGEDGIDLNRGAYSESTQASLSMAQISDGSYFFAWTEYRYEGENEVGRILIDRISADGEHLWEQPLEITQENTPMTYPYLLDAGNNQVLLVYAKGSGQELTVKKLDFDGTDVWNEDTNVYRHGFVSIPLWTFLKVMTDGNGGVFIGWYDDREGTGYERTYVAHIDTDGKHTFASGIGGEAVGYAIGLRSFAPEMYYDKENQHLYVLHCEATDGHIEYRLMLQKMNMSGELLFGDEGVEVFPLTEMSLGYQCLQDDGEGNVAVFFLGNRKTFGSDNVAGYFMKVDKADGYIINDTPVQFTPGEGNRQALKVSPLVDGQYWIAMWMDKRILPTDDTNVDVTELPRRLYMQRIFKDGSIGNASGISQIESTSNFTARQAGSQIAISLPEDVESAVADIYSADGSKRMSVSIENSTTSISADSLIPGIYILKFSSSGFVKTIKLTIK